MNHPEAARSHHRPRDIGKSPLRSSIERIKLPSEIQFSQQEESEHGNRTLVSMSTIGDDDSLFDASPLVLGDWRKNKGSRRASSDRVRATDRLRRTKSSEHNNDPTRLSLLHQLSIGLNTESDDSDDNDFRNPQHVTPYIGRLNDEDDERMKREKRNSAAPIVKPQRKMSREYPDLPPRQPTSDTTGMTADLSSDIEDDDSEEYSDCEVSLQGMNNTSNFFDMSIRTEAETIADDTIVEEEQFELLDDPDDDLSVSMRSGPSAPKEKARWSPSTAGIKGLFIKKPTRKCSIGYAAPSSTHSRSGHSRHTNNNNTKEGSKRRYRRKASILDRSGRSTASNFLDQSGRSTASNFLDQSGRSMASRSPGPRRKYYSGNNNSTSSHATRRSFMRNTTMDLTSSQRSQYRGPSSRK